MTARATFTQAQITRAIKAAEAAGKVAVQTPMGIAFVDPAMLPQHAPAEPPANPFDAWKAKRDASQAQGY